MGCKIPESIEIKWKIDLNRFKAIPEFYLGPIKRQ